MNNNNALTIGMLMPRSTDYPAMGFDIVHGLRASIALHNSIQLNVLTESINFGEDVKAIYAAAEKLLLNGADMIVAYCSALNAEALYPLSEATGKLFVFLDPGMSSFCATPPANCYHVSLQGNHACRLAGLLAGSGKRNVLMATSFYDGGYRGPWFYDRGLSAAGGSVCGNYVSGYKTAEFSIDQYISLVNGSGAGSVAACFSTYLAELFYQQLHKRRNEMQTIPLYCSPFMAEEQMLEKCKFPGGELKTVVPWSYKLENVAQGVFEKAIGQNKRPNLFHLLGWEAGIIAADAMQQRLSDSGYRYESPRGTVTVHPLTHTTFCDLYEGSIAEDEDGNCTLIIERAIAVSAEDHLSVLNDHPQDVVSGWRNNYLCS